MNKLTKIVLLSGLLILTVSFTIYVNIALFKAVKESEQPSLPTDYSTVGFLSLPREYSTLSF